MNRRLLAAAMVALVLPLLVACTPPQVDDTAAPSSKPSVTPTEAATPAPAAQPTQEPAAPPAPTFTQPTTCAELTGPDLAAELASRNKVLFNSSNGEGNSAGAPVDTHQQGGNPFGCLWGVPGVDLNTMVLSTQPLSHQAHEGVTAILEGGGYVKTVNGDVVTYTYLGNETGQTTEQLTIHVLRPDSWITGWAPIGGETMRVRINGYLDAVAEQLYN